MWLQVSLIVVGMFTLPTMVLWFVTGPVLKAFGAEQQLAADAGLFASILACSLPGRTAYSQLTSYFSAQKIVRPTAYASSAGCMLNLALGLVLVLGVFVPGWDGFGFVACPLTTVVTEYAMAIGFWYYACRLKKLHEETWGGWDTDEITWSRIKEFLRLYVPAAASMASDWWRVTVIGVFAARMGPLQIAVFNTGYRITWMTLTLVGSLGGALGARLGIQIGQGDIDGGKQTVLVGGGICCGTLAFLSVVVYIMVRPIGAIFSDDPEVIDQFVQSRLPLATMIFTMNLSVFLERIPVAMGRTKIVFYAGVVGSWVGQVPGVVLALHFWRNDLVGLYWGVSFGYMLLCLLLIFIIQRVNWQDIVSEGQQRAFSK
jgi:MATE family multidrug resistance protein